MPNKRLAFDLYVDYSAERGYHYADIVFRLMDKETLPPKRDGSRFSKTAKALCEILGLAYITYLTRGSSKIIQQPIMHHDHKFNTKELRRMLQDSNRENKLIDVRIPRSNLREVLSTDALDRTYVNTQELALPLCSIKWKEGGAPLSKRHIQKLIRSLIPATASEPDFPNDTAVRAELFGRDTDIDKLLNLAIKSLEESESASCSPKPIVLSGVPGIGKTKLINSIRGQLNDLATLPSIWLDNESTPGNQALLGDMADKFHIPIDSDVTPNDSIITSIARGIGQQSAVAVIDNYNSLDDVHGLRISGTNILLIILSRKILPPSLDHEAYTYRLGYLSKNDSTKLVNSVISDKCRIMQRDISSVITSPFAMPPQILRSLAGRINTLSDLPGLSNSDFIDRTSELIATYGNTPYEENEKTSIEVYGEHLKSLSKHAQAAIPLLGAVAPRPTEISFKMASTIFGPHHHAILDELQSSLVVDCNNHNGSFSIHQMFRDAAQSLSSGEEQIAAATCIAQFYRDCIGDVQASLNDPKIDSDRELDCHIAHMNCAAAMLKNNHAWNAYYDLSCLQCRLLNAASRWSDCLHRHGKDLLHTISSKSNFKLRSAFVASFYLSWPAWMSGQYSKCRALLDEAIVDLREANDDSDSLFRMETTVSVYHNYHKLSIMELNSSGHLLHATNNGNELLENTIEYADIAMSTVLQYEAVNSPTTKTEQLRFMTICDQGYAKLAQGKFHDAEVLFRERLKNISSNKTAKLTRMLDVGLTLLGQKKRDQLKQLSADMSNLFKQGHGQRDDLQLEFAFQNHYAQKYLGIRCLPEFKNERLILERWRKTSRSNRRMPFAKLVADQLERGES